MTSRADLTLVTSPQMQQELQENGVKRVDVWRKGIDTIRFSPEFRSEGARCATRAAQCAALGLEFGSRPSP